MRLKRLDQVDTLLHNSVPLSKVMGVLALERWIDSVEPPLTFWYASTPTGVLGSGADWSRPGLEESSVLQKSFCRRHLC
jgi:hypothetical protein